MALKEIKLQFQEGLPFTAIREASLLRTLRHANIVCLHDIYLQHNQLTFVFEYMVRITVAGRTENSENGSEQISRGASDRLDQSADDAPIVSTSSWLGLLPQEEDPPPVRKPLFPLGKKDLGT